MRALLMMLALGQPAAAMELITPDAFLDRAVGKTLSFNVPDTGLLIGIEQFLSRNLSVWARANGSCSYGTITVRGPQLCFVYSDKPDTDFCWYTFDDEGTLFVGMPAKMDVQYVSQITEEPVICEGAPLS